MSRVGKPAPAGARRLAHGCRLALESIRWVDNLMDRRLLILALGMFAMGTDNFVVAGILPGVAASLHTSVSAAGLMVTFYALTYAVAAPVMAAVAGTWPRKLLLVAALSIFAIGNAIRAPMTMIARTIQAVWVIVRLLQEVRKQQRTAAFEGARIRR